MCCVGYALDVLCVFLCCLVADTNIQTDTRGHRCVGYSLDVLCVLQQVTRCMCCVCYSK